MNEPSPCSLGEVFLAQLMAQPDAIALWESRPDALLSYSWREIASRVAGVLESLKQRGILRGAHIATWLPNGVDWIAVDLAAQLGGLVHVALDVRLPLGTARAFAERASASLLLSTAQRVDQSTDQTRQSHGLRLLPVEPLCMLSSRIDGLSARSTEYRPRPDDLAMILTTSGTMSDPKGVMLSHRNLLSNAVAKLGAAPQWADDVRLNVLPFAHAYARTCELSTWIISGSQLCIARDWNDLLTLAPRVRPTLLNLVPHLAHKLVAALDRADSGLSGAGAGAQVLGDRLRLLQVGGAALPRDIWNRLAAEGWPPLQGYGLTESSPVICSNRAGDQRPETVGRAVQGVEVRVDERGVLWTRGPHVMLGYWQSPLETAARIKDGWLCTGDLVEVTEEGHWRIIGRADDQITLSTGYKAAPHELTRRLAHDPWVEQLVIVGQNRPYLVALVYPRTSALPIELFDGTEDDEVPERDVGWLNAARFEQALVERWTPDQAELPRQLRIERVGLMRRPLTTAGGGLNFKGAIRRKVVEQVLLAEQIDDLYRASKPDATQV